MTMRLQSVVLATIVSTYNVVSSAPQTYSDMWEIATDLGPQDIHGGASLALLLVLANARHDRHPVLHAVCDLRTQELLGLSCHEHVLE